MKKLVILGVVAVLAGVAAFFLMRTHKLAATGGPLLDTLPELAWVRTDLGLTDTQFAKVSALHLAYRPKCVEMCRNISLAHEKLASLTHCGREVTPELEVAIREHAEVHAQCQAAMMKHLYETAATLDEKQASRYLETMLPFALGFATGGSECQHSH